MIERILCAAIWYNDDLEYPYQPKNIKSGYVWCGRRHHNIINLRAKITGLKTRNDVQGFITSDDRFVDRKEAMLIAKESGQVPKNQSFEELFSEDLY